MDQPITVDDLIQLRADVRDAVDHHRAIFYEYDDPSHPDVIAAYEQRERAYDTWWGAYKRAAPDVIWRYYDRTDPAAAARRDAS